MTALIVIRRNQLGRTPTRGKSCARPTPCGKGGSIFPKHGASARNGLRKLAGYQLLRVRAGDRGLRSLHGPAIQFLPAHPFSGLHRAPAFFQSSARAVAYVFQKLSLSAGSTGLVAAPDGHRGSERKFGNVRKSSGEIRNVER